MRYDFRRLSATSTRLSLIGTHPTFSLTCVHCLGVQLKEIVGIFIVPPENIKGLIDHGHLANRDKREVYHYISLRADYR